MEKVKKYVTVYTEANPNPNSMKFVVNYMLAPEGLNFDYPNAESAIQTPIAAEIFSNFPFVTRVFIMNNFLTITKNEIISWEEVARDLKLFVQDYLEDEKEIFSTEFMKKNSVIVDTDTEIVRKIKNILEEYIRPAVETDGGAINFHSFDEASGVVKVTLQGACSGCPSSTVTLKAGIENLLKNMLPEVKEVVSENL